MTWNAGRWLWSVAALAGLLAAVQRPAAAIEVWMPQTGQVDLDGLPRRTPEERFKHAAALIGAGQAMSGLRQMENLLKECPDAPFAEQGRYLTAVGYFTEKLYRKAFAAWQDFHAKFPESGLRQDAYEMQLYAARHETEQDADRGILLYARLAAAAPTRDFAMRCDKEKADALLAVGDYYGARAEYLSFVDTYPDSPWVPYCWFKIGECELGLARWIKRGTEHLDDAGRALSDYMEAFPHDQHLPQGQELMKQVQEERAAKYREIAEFYLERQKRPTAAMPYLEYLATAFPDTKDARWAREKMEALRAERKAPMPGTMPEAPVPGVSSQEGAGAPTDETGSK